MRLKQMQLNTKMLTYLLIAMFICTACSDNSVNSDDTNDLEVGENFTFYTNESMAEEAAKNRSEEISDPFEIENVTIEDKNGKKWMHVEVIQVQGCKESYPDKFRVIWDGIMLMIYPPQVGFYLKYDSSRCSELEENVKETITLDLYKIFEDKEFVDEVAKFTVANASKSTTEDDYGLERPGN